jgi:hypothetical protein
MVMIKLILVIACLVSFNSFAEPTSINYGSNFVHNSYTQVSAAGTLSVSSESIDISPYEVGAIQLVYNNIATNTVFNLEASLDDGTSWDAVSGLTVTASNTGSDLIPITNMVGGLMRVTIAATTGRTPSNFTPYLIGKGSK